jgi:hypothetical protein
MAIRPVQPPGSPLIWLLLISGLFWGGLFGSEALVNRWNQSRKPAVPVPVPQPGRELDLSAARQLLQPDAERQAGPATAVGDVRLPGSPPPQVAAQPALPPLVAAAPARASTSAPLLDQPPMPSPAAAALLSGADALGGEITLASLGEPRMLPAARAERLQWQRSGNPLAPLPLHWQQRLQRELAGGAPIQRAEMVRVPVSPLQQREEVAVVIDDSGSAQSLNMPTQEPVREAVEAWASRQSPAEAGQVRAVVIAAEPLPAAPAAPEFSPAPVRAEPAEP